jgi:hypothetical protein
MGNLHGQHLAADKIRQAFLAHPLVRGTLCFLQQGVGKHETPSLSPRFALRKGEKV